MSGMEIERKFLVKKAGAPWRALASSRSRIKQGYMDCNGATVRVRLRDEKAYLTIKGPSKDGIGRYEFEKEITKEEALNLLMLCRGGMIDKTRYLVEMHDRHVFEVDEFHGDNDGLIVAEVELASADEPFEKPDFIDTEVTGDRKYYNSHLLRNPFSAW